MQHINSRDTLTPAVAVVFHASKSPGTMAIHGTLRDFSYPEDLFRDVSYSDFVYGRLDLTESDLCFCRCFWTFDVNIDMLRGSDAVTVRYRDESLALQPCDMHGNATGMVNDR